MSCTSNGIISQASGCSRTVMLVPQRRRHAFFTTAKASGRISFNRRASSSSSRILEISYLQAVVEASDLLCDIPNHDCLDYYETLREPSSGVKDISEARRIGKRRFDGLLAWNHAPVRRARPVGAS